MAEQANAVVATAAQSAQIENIPSSSGVVTLVTARPAYDRAYARWCRAKANEGRRPQYIIDAIRIRTMDAMIEARWGDGHA